MQFRRDGILLVLLVLMEMLAGFAIVVGSSLLDAISLGYGMFWLLLFSSFIGLAIALVVAGVGPGEPWNRAMLLAGAIMGAGLPAVIISRNRVTLIVSLFLLLIAYWRGIAAAQESPSHSDVLSRFGFGFILLFLGLIWVVARGIDHERPVWQMLAYIGIAYTITTLVALGVSRVEHAREPGAGAAVLLAVVVQLGAIMLIGLAALQIFSYDVVGAVFQPTRPFWDSLGSGIFHVFALLAAPVQWFFDLVRPHGHGAKPYVPPPPRPQSFGRKPKHPPQSNPSVAIGAFIVAVLILGGILFLIWRSIPRLQRKNVYKGFAEERTSLSLAQIFHSLLSWLRHLFSHTVEVTATAFRSGKRHFFPQLPEDPVRRVYAQLLRRASLLGLERPAGTTPVEFHLRLAERWPHAEADIGGITEAYVMRRYGELEISSVQLAQTRERWQRVRIVMRQAQLRSATSPSTTDSLESSPDALPKRTRMAALRNVFRMPEPILGVDEPSLKRSFGVAAVSLFVPILIIVGLLVALALISTAAGH